MTLIFSTLLSSSYSPSCLWAEKTLIWLSHRLRKAEACTQGSVWDLCSLLMLENSLLVQTGVTAACTLLGGRANTWGFCPIRRSSSRSGLPCPVGVGAWFQPPFLPMAAETISLKQWLKAQGVSAWCWRENPLERGCFCLGVQALSLKYRTIRIPEVNRVVLWLSFRARVTLEQAPRRLSAYCCLGGFLAE